MSSKVLLALYIKELLNDPKFQKKIKAVDEEYVNPERLLDSDGGRYPADLREGLMGGPDGITVY